MNQNIIEIEGTAITPSVNLTDHFQFAVRSDRYVLLDNGSAPFIFSAQINVRKGHRKNRQRHRQK